MKTGKNQPCPCGSGKKYQDCCQKKQSQQTKPVSKLKHPGTLSLVPTDQSKVNNSREDLLSVGAIGDYGDPQISEELFESELVEFSPQKFLYLNLVEPEIEALASSIFGKVAAPNRELQKRIARAKKLDDLLTLLYQPLDPDNERFLIDRLLEDEDELLPKLFDALQNPHNDKFAETAIKILADTSIECADVVAALIKLPIRQASTVSKLCVLLGFIGNEEHIKPLWDCYCFFKENYPRKFYDQGPLIGLMELCLEQDELTEEELANEFAGDEFFGDALDGAVEFTVEAGDLFVQEDSFIEIWDQQFEEWQERDWQEWLTDHLVFPFHAVKVKDSTSTRSNPNSVVFPLQAKLEISGPIEYDNSLQRFLVKAKQGRQKGQIALSDLVVANRENENYPIVKEYFLWCANH